jgi:hypothetical protein
MQDAAVQAPGACWYLQPHGLDHDRVFLILIMQFASKHSLFPRACNVRGSFNLFHIIANAFAVTTHNTARVALFDTMTKCIVAFQSVCGGLDRNIGAQDRAAFKTMKYKGGPQC